MEPVATSYPWKEHEIFSSLRLPKCGFYVVRCDGRNFHRLTEECGFQKPYDKRFAELMVEATLEVFRSGFNPCLAYIFSDEVNILLLRLPFNGRLEKIVSTISGILSSAFSLKLKEKLGVEKTSAFDSRMILLNRELLPSYLAYRQAEAWRNHNNSYAYYTLINKGYAPKEASVMLKGLKTNQLHELVYKMSGLNLSKTPSWQRRGILIKYLIEKKYGYNPVKKRKVVTYRRRLTVNWEPPLFESEKGREIIEESIRNFLDYPPHDGKARSQYSSF
ncbi:MAG: tRNA 5'-guanylyltransferase [Thermoproteota archaeon]|nr:MAG: tRNA 5'-guanylyltransferase [Candidatus Korarchaeota archaeon]